MAGADQWLIDKIVSGGQTGADRAALDWACQRGVVHEGWCPKGRLAADGPLPEQFCLGDRLIYKSDHRVLVSRRDQNLQDSALGQRVTRRVFQLLDQVEF